MKTLILYSTAGCHLCEQAEAILFACLNEENWRLDIVDIAENDDLIERYGLKIPVLAMTDSLAELGWPFDALKLQAYLQLHE